MHAFLLAIGVAMAGDPAVDFGIVHAFPQEFADDFNKRWRLVNIWAEKNRAFRGFEIWPGKIGAARETNVIVNMRIHTTVASRIFSAELHPADPGALLLSSRRKMYYRFDGPYLFMELPATVLPEIGRLRVTMRRRE